MISISTIKTAQKAKKIDPSHLKNYQIIGHSYIQLKNYKKAHSIFTAGIENLPNNGAIYTEKGRLFMLEEKYLEALHVFEDGVLKCPNYASNYYWASKIYATSTEKIWALFYGELFMNLEPDSYRTDEISKVLYRTLKNNIIISKDSMSVNLSKDMNVPSSKIDSNYVSFGQDVVENAVQEIIREDSIQVITIESIIQLKRALVKKLNQSQINPYPTHLLFQYYKKLIESGDFEAYNHWIYMMGNIDEFKSWEQHHTTKWVHFQNWMVQQEFTINPQDHFHSSSFQ